MSDDEYQEARERMVETQIRRRGLDREALLEAMRAVPRHLFVPGKFRARAYDDCPLPTFLGQTISQPYMVALMTDLLNLEPGMKVLEVGTGSGYQTALLLQFGAIVHSIEREKELADFARDNLEAAGLTENCTIHVGDGSLGLPAEAPFERILVTAGAPHLPAAYQEQLVDGGRVIIPIGGDRYGQQLLAYDLEKEKWREIKSIYCAFVPLRGADAW